MISLKEYVCVERTALYWKGCRVKVWCYSHPIKEAYHIIVGDPLDNIIRPFPVDEFREYFVKLSVYLRCEKIKKIKKLLNLL